MTTPDGESRHDNALARLAREAAPEVLQAALARAREDAVARLSALLADEIVAQALAAPPERPTVQLQENRVAQTLYAYAITRTGLDLPDDVAALTGGEAVRLIADGDLALLVSPLDADQLEIDEDDLSENGRLATLARGHDAVVRAAATAGPVLPLRFGTAVPDDDAARRLLRTHAEAALRQLERIGDTREWGVRLVRPVAEPAMAGPAPARPAHRQTHRQNISGREYLARRRQALEEHERAGQDAAEAVERLEKALAPYVAETLRRGGNTGSSQLLDVACLVPPHREPGFAAAVADLAEQLRPQHLDVELTGPWPPDSFASLDAAPGVSDGT